MRRRTALQLAGTTLLGGLAGCSAVTESRLRDPRTEREDDQTHHVYTRGEERILEVSALRFGVPAPEYAIPLKLFVWHRGGTHLDAVRYEIQLNEPGKPLPEVFMTRLSGYPTPRVTFGRNREADATVVDIPELGSQGTGSFGLDLVVVPFGDWEERVVTVRYDLDLSQNGVDPRRYTASDALEFPVTR
ncbi:hypothetical protein [Natronomonas sp. EA1]|uniref:hypothetical protein n=1 Tax=Natronomonas sp. EA1 TaxID=3421655 RepID=UPI003EBBCDB6